MVLWEVWACVCTVGSRGLCGTVGRRDLCGHMGSRG